MSGKRVLEDSRGNPSHWKRTRQDNRTTRSTYRPSNNRSLHAIPSSELASSFSDKTPTLLDLKAELKRSKRYLWDSPPTNYENINLHALKLFGLATPQTDFKTQSIPDEIEKFRHVRSLEVSDSVVFRLINNKIYPTLKEAAIKVAKSQEEVSRPALAYDLLKSKPQNHILLHKNTVLHPSTCQFEFDEQLRLNQEYTASRLKYRPSQLPDSYRFLFPAPKPSKMKVEVLNVFPMQEHNKELWLDALKELCIQAGFAPLHISSSSGPIYQLPRVFIELLDSEQCIPLAKALGQKRLGDRPLIVTIQKVNDMTTNESEK